MVVKWSWILARCPFPNSVRLRSAFLQLAARLLGVGMRCVEFDLEDDLVAVMRWARGTSAVFEVDRFRGLVAAEFGDASARLRPAV